MDTFLAVIRQLGGARLAVILGALGVVIGFFFYVLNGVNQSDMGILYSNIDPAEGGQIVAKLEALSIPHIVQENGTHIEVPKGEIGRLRMVLAEAGLPSGGSIGYEIFDRNEPFGMTSFVQDVQHLRALEGELARSIRTLSKVSNARVHLVLPKRELFSKQAPTPSASIILKMSGANRLSQEQVEAIVHLVASAVSGLSPNNISVIDNKGMLLTKPSEKNSAGGMNPDTATEMRLNYEMRTARMIEGLLEKSVGTGKVRAEVTAEMNFDQFSENAEIYDPEGQVVRSTQTAQENSSANDAAAQALTIENNIPKAGGTGGGNQNKTESNRKEEAINYEISKTIRTHIKEFGAIKRISVAVMVDGVYDTSTDPKVAPKYRPRTTEELDQLKKLVQSAVGYKQDRGDTVEVFNLAFIDSDILPKEEEKFINLSHTDILHLIELAVVIVLGIIIILTVIKPAINRLIEGALAQKAAIAAASVSAPASVTAATNESTKDIPENNISKQFNLGKIEGDIRASTLSTVAKIIDENPDKTINLLRSWMAEDTSKKEPA